MLSDNSVHFPVLFLLCGAAGIIYWEPLSGDVAPRRAYDAEDTHTHVTESTNVVSASQAKPLQPFVAVAVCLRGAYVQKA